MKKTCNVVFRRDDGHAVPGVGILNVVVVGAGLRDDRDVDGMEVEGSAAEADVRVLPADQYPATIEGR